MLHCAKKCLKFGVCELQVQVTNPHKGETFLLHVLQVNVSFWWGWALVRYGVHCAVYERSNEVLTRVANIMNILIGLRFAFIICNDILYSKLRQSYKVRPCYYAPLYEH